VHIFTVINLHKLTASDIKLHIVHCTLQSTSVPNISNSRRLQCPENLQGMMRVTGWLDGGTTGQMAEEGRSRSQLQKPKFAWWVSLRRNHLCRVSR